ncbi:GNAT family N-acetyltransferase [Streptomyces sp. NPDC002215]|uniref:GNAT family N-acetyltransferase n=1 Tax=Streptomyces sp. NPDC002215 TaxID=3154412 RepID=UPI0033208359
MFPEMVLHSRRLVLRAFDSSDIPDTHASCSDSLTQRWLPLPQPYTLDDATAWCTTTARAMRDSGDGIQFAITDASTKCLMGQVGLKKTDWRALVSEVGYWVSPWARGHGIAAKATRTLAHWLLTNQHFQRWNCELPPRTPRPRQSHSKLASTANAPYETLDSYTELKSTWFCSPCCPTTSGHRLIPRSTAKFRVLAQLL